MGFIIFLLVIAIIIATIIVTISSKKEKNANKNKVASFQPKSKPLPIFHVSGLPIAPDVSIFIYNCNDSILLSNADNNFTISKSKINGCDITPKLLSWLLTIHYESDGIQKSVVLKGGEDIKNIKKILDRECIDKWKTTSL